MEMRERKILSLGPGGFHHIAFDEWGDPDNKRIVICVHGLLRNKHDFDELAAALAHDWRVISVDIPGRGDSDWLAPKSAYDIPVYCQGLAALFAHLGTEEVSFIGTSMGGLIGMALAAYPKTPIKQLVLNDVGPFIPKAALERIKAYACMPEAHFASIDEAEAWLRVAYASFGKLSDRQWRHMAAHSIRPVHGGHGFRFHYDPGITQGLAAIEPTDVELWPVWDAIRCPVLVLRGASSDLLLPETVEEMQGRGPGCEVEIIEGCGHAPSLMDARQIEIVKGWIEA